MVLRLIVALALAGTAVAQEPAEEKVALLFGVNRYHAPGLAPSPLDHAEADVRDVAAELGKHGFVVTTLVGPKATKAGIEAAINKALEPANHLRTTLVGLAGHGFQDVAFDEEGRPRKGPDGRYLQDVYYCPVDAVVGEFPTMVSLDALMGTLERRSGTNLVLIDACRNEAPSPFRGARAMISGKAFVGRLPENMAVFFACSGGQRAFETNQAGGGHGVFFWHVLQGLRGEGEAAHPKTGEVRWDRLVSHVNEHVNASARDWFPDQARAADKSPDARGRLQVPQELRSLSEMPVLARVKVATRTADVAKAMVVTEPEPPRSPVGMEGSRAGQVREDKLLKMPLVWCPPGSFTMGSPDLKKARFDDEKQVKVTINPGFWIGKYEFRQSDYKALIGTDPSHYKGDPNRPVESVDWDTAQKVGATLTQRERAAGRLPVGWEYRLPTEAEWEYACRSGEKGDFCFGDDGTRLEEFAWFRNNTPNTTHAVGAKKANAWGVHDMHGNVSEWCMDGYSEALPGGLNPRGPDGAACRVGRGGSWGHSGLDCMSAYRREINPAHSSEALGLRVVAVWSPG